MLRKPQVLLLVILALAVVARLALFAGYRNGDMGNYVQEAHNLAVGHYSVAEVLAHKDLDELVPGPNFNWQNLRLGLLLPTAWSFRAFGVNNFAYAWLMFATLGLGACVTYLFARDTISLEAAPVAAAVFCFIPLELNLTSTLIPHLPAAAVTGLAFYLLHRSLGSASYAGDLAAFLAGVAASVAYLIYELSILIAGVVGVYLILRFYVGDAAQRRRAFRSGASMALGFLPLFAAELYYFYHLSGILFFRQAFISKLSPTWTLLHPADLNFLALDRYPRAMAASYHFGLFYYLVFLGLIWRVGSGLRRAGRRSLGSTTSMLLLWFGLLGLYLQFGTSSLTRYEPVFKLNHYLAVLSIPGAVFAAYGLTRLARILPVRPRGAGLALAVVCFIGSSMLCSWVLYVGKGPYRPDLTHEQELRAVIDELPGDLPVYTDKWTKDGLDFAYGYRRDVRAFTAIANLPTPEIDPATIPRGILLLNWRYLRGVHTMATRVPSWIEAPPANWRLYRALSDGGVQLYISG